MISGQSQQHILSDRSVNEDGSPLRNSNKGAVIQHQRQKRGSGNIMSGTGMPKQAIIVPKHTIIRAPISQTQSMLSQVSGNPKV